MSQIITVKQITEDYRAKLKELCSKATQVVGWYAHNHEVRGPFCRWFEITEVAPEYRKYVGARWDDAEFCAAAMNSLPALLELLDQKDAKIAELKRDIIEKRNG